MASTQARPEEASCALAGISTHGVSPGSKGGKPQAPWAGAVLLASLPSLEPSEKWGSPIGRVHCWAGLTARACDSIPGVSISYVGGGGPGTETFIHCLRGHQQGARLYQPGLKHSDTNRGVPHSDLAPRYHDTDPGRRPGLRKPGPLIQGRGGHSVSVDPDLKPVVSTWLRGPGPLIVQIWHFRGQSPRSAE